jgi:dipeptidase E
MRLYLSSYLLGDYPEHLLSLVGSGRKVAIIENALDEYSPEARENYRQKNFDVINAFKDLGFNTELLDLQDYFLENDTFDRLLEQKDLIWSVGGNTFLLRYAMGKSGFDRALRKALENDQVAYGGWSAGICVLAPTLKGISPGDQPEKVREIHGDEAIWDGLGLIDYMPLPHYKSDHKEAELMNDCAEYMDQHNLKYEPLQDGDVIIYQGKDHEILRKRTEQSKGQFNHPRQN